MLKYKVIGAFVAVWCAVCLMYVGVRAALGALIDRTAQVETSETVEEQAAIVAPEPEVNSTPEPVATPEPAAESELVVSENSDDPIDESENQAQEAETFEVPSLVEYLSWFTCGSCRRNCSLANPRCHNGSRLAQQKAQEYYELYG